MNHGVFAVIENDAEYRHGVTSRTQACAGKK